MESYEPPPVVTTRSRSYRPADLRQPIATAARLAREQVARAGLALIAIAIAIVWCGVAVCSVVVLVLWGMLIHLRLRLSDAPGRRADAESS